MSIYSKRTSFKRWHPLLGEWVVIAPTTAVRPWSGTVVSSVKSDLPEHDPGCYLCPGVRRAGGDVNPDYADVHVFDNDFPSLTMQSKVTGGENTSLDSPALGICRVVCFSPKHNITLAEMDPGEIETVVRTFRDQYRELSAVPEIRHVMMFENKGAIIGVSNPHPHGQIYASDFVPRIPLTQHDNAAAYMKKKGKCLFCTILEDELADGRRIVSENESFAAFVPSFARHTFEVHIMPKRHVYTILDLSDDELAALAGIYREMLVRYDNLFRMPFPNITIFYNAPCSGEYDPEPYHFHIEFCPPLRSRDKLKYMAGFETGGGNIINPSLPVESAEALRSLPVEHYLRSESG